MKVGLDLTNVGIKNRQTSLANSQSPIKKAPTFTGNNMNQIAHVVPEFHKNLFKGGGVADVIYDIATVFPKLDPSKEHSFFLPFYNADYYTDSEGKTVMNPVQYDGKKYIVSDTRDISKNNGNVNKFEVSHIARNTMETVDSTGKSINVDADLFQINADELFAQIGVDPTKVKVYTTLTPGTGTMDKQYGFSYKDGALFKHYSENSKGSINGMETLHKLDPSYDPANIVFHDVHGTAGMAHIQHKANEGSELFQKMNIAKIIHNDGAGYQCEDASPFDMFASYATPKQVKQLTSSQEYIDAVKAMPMDNGKALSNLIKTTMPGMLDDTGNLNPALIEYVMGHGENGVVKTVGVSDPYIEEICTIPEMTGNRLSKKLSVLREEDKIKGIINGSEFPDEEHFIAEALFNPHQKNKVELKYGDGSVVEYFKTYNPREIKTMEDIVEKVLPVKENNTYPFFERLVRKNDIVPPAEAKNWSPNMAVTGLIDKPAPKIYTTIDESFLNLLKSGEKVNIIDGWGRGGHQKDAETMLQGFMKHVRNNTEDTTSVLMAGFSLGSDDSSKATQKFLDEMLSDPLFKNRVLFIDGWVGPDAMTSVCDNSLFSSRFEPCGLTAPVAMAKGSVPMASKTGGQQAMVLDGVNGMTTKTAYYKIGKKEIAESPYADAFQKEYDALINKQTELLSDRDYRFIRQGVKAPVVNADQIVEMVEKSGDYNKILHKYRNSIMSDEYQTLFKRMFHQTEEEKLGMMLESFKAKDRLSWTASQKEYNAFLWQDAPKDVTKAAKVIEQDILDALTPVKHGVAGSSLDINTRGIEDQIGGLNTTMKEGLDKMATALKEGSEAGNTKLKGFLGNLDFKGQVALAATGAAIAISAVWAVIARDNAKKEAEAEKAVAAAKYVPSVPVNPVQSVPVAKA